MSKPSDTKYNDPTTAVEKWVCDLEHTVVRRRRIYLLLLLYVEVPVPNIEIKLTMDQLISQLRAIFVVQEDAKTTLIKHERNASLANASDSD